jgi:hypothetical protein
MNYEDSIKTDPNKRGHWWILYLAPDSDKWRYIVRVVMKLYNGRNFWAKWGNKLLLKKDTALELICCLGGYLVSQSVSWLVS